MIYIFEKDLNIVDQMVSTLQEEGFEVQQIADRTHFEEAMAEALPELLILEMTRSDTEWIQILTGLRKNKKTRLLPVILLSERNDEKSIAHGLDQGADDLIQKPFGMLELCSRVRALLRRAKAAEEKTAAGIFEIGSLKVDNNRHIVTVSGQPIALSLKEYSVLTMLLDADGEVCTREELLSEIWGSNYGESRTLDVHIRRLREKLRSAGEIIQTVKGVGYRIEERE